MECDRPADDNLVCEQIQLLFIAPDRFGIVVAVCGGHIVGVLNVENVTGVDNEFFHSVSRA